EESPCATWRKTWPTDRTSGAGRHPYLSAGKASASSTSFLPTASTSAAYSARNPVRDAAASGGRAETWVLVVAGACARTSDAHAHAARPTIEIGRFMVPASSCSVQVY